MEVRQLLNPKQEEQDRLWASWIEHPDPQILKPGERAKACLIVDPDIADVKPGTKAEFAVTGFINGRTVGGINVQLTKTEKQKKAPSVVKTRTLKRSRPKRETKENVKSNIFIKK